jgi:tRNA-splicing ligase RtcB
MPDDVMAPVFRWLTNPCGPRLESQINRLAKLRDVCHVAVMPDLHEGKKVPNGIVVASRHRLYPDLVGSDIGCGISAICFQEVAERLNARDLRQLLESLVGAVPTIKQTKSIAHKYQHLIENMGQLSRARLDNAARRDGLFQLGTLGRGNHFLELCKDSRDRLWAVVHTGSRAMGQLITEHHRPMAASASEPDDYLVSLDRRSAEGQAYLADMQWACRYASTNRQVILNALADLLEELFRIDVSEETFVDSPHNIALVHKSEENDTIVHRKSSNLADSGRLGLIAGSMKTGTYIVRGLGNSDALQSSSHGAGRLLSRTDAAKTLSAKEMANSLQSVVWHQRWAERLVDESPRAYRDLSQVISAQRDLVAPVDLLQPLLNDKRT